MPVGNSKSQELENFKSFCLHILTGETECNGWMDGWVDLSGVGGGDGWMVLLDLIHYVLVNNFSVMSGRVLLG